MGSLNQVTLIGNVGKDPEIKHLQNSKVANFSIATSESYKDKDGNKVDKTEWHNIVAWKGLAEVAERFVKKGQQVSIVGKLTYRTWDKPDGTKGYMTEVVVKDLVLLRNDGSQQSQAGGEELPSMPAGKPATVSQAAPNSEDDLPF